MKRLLSFILALILIIGLVACGKKLPNGFDQKLYDYAEAAYELVRDYNHGKISKDDAVERANTIATNVESLPIPQNKDEAFLNLYTNKQSAIPIYLKTFTNNLTLPPEYIFLDNTTLEDVFKSFIEE